jgi:hypothetical protein
VSTGAHCARLITYFKLTASQGSHSYTELVTTPCCDQVYWRNNLSFKSSRKRDFTTHYIHVHLSAHQPTFKSNLTVISQHNCYAKEHKPDSTALIS